ncbi:MAG TPA: RusA family crossover junction endodeoxyribonuclease [Rhabdochlamydiaceae bacterium]|nr:RusA family crossover junction endodeoxyribonuclease [Rhabdochlamydiaceae bacterium]
MKVELNIPLDPVPWASPRVLKTHCWDPREKDKWAARFHIYDQYDGEPYQKYVAALFFFAFEPPASASLKKRVQMLSGEIRPMRCDCTNLQKLYEDCLKGIVIQDDRQVCVVSSYKCYEEKGSVQIIVQDLDEYFAEHEQMQRI